MKDCVSSLHVGLRILTLWALFLDEFNICDSEGCFSYGNKPTVTRKRPLHSIPFFHTLENPQPDYTRRDSSALWIIRTLSRIDRICSNQTMAEARDLYCYSHVFENLENRSNPSDHAAVRLVIHKPTNREQQCKRNTSWTSKHLVFCSEPLHDYHRFSADPFGALAEFKAILEGSEADDS